MAVALYAYFDDANREYQVSLPDDFAVALSYEPSSVLAPYIPQEISPRYLSYWAQQTNQYRAVVCPNRATWVNPPQEINIDGVMWSLSGFYGEKFQQLPGGNVVVMAGVQGPPGEPGQADLAYYGDTAISDSTMPVANQGYSILILSDVEPGVYFVAGIVQFQTGATAARLSMVVTPNGVGNVGQAGGSVWGATANQYYSVSASGLIFVNTPGTDLIMVCQSTATNSAVRVTTPSIGGVTQLTALKIAS